MSVATLTQALFLGHLATCVAAHPEVRDAPARRVIAHAIGESALHPFAVHDNATGERQFFQSATEAIAMAQKWLARGDRVDAGIMQITDSNWKASGLTVQTVFDPAANICAGARILAEAFAIERRAACRYNSGQPVCTAYANAIDKAEEQAAAPAVAVVSSAPPAPPPCAPAWDGMALARCNARRLAAASHAAEGTKAPSAGSVIGLAFGEVSP